MTVVSARFRLDPYDFPLPEELSRERFLTGALSAGLVGLIVYFRAVRKRPKGPLCRKWSWISFNAAYAHEAPNRWELNERKIPSKFISILIDVDDEQV